MIARWQKACWGPSAQQNSALPKPPLSATGYARVSGGVIAMPAKLRNGFQIQRKAIHVDSMSRSYHMPRESGWRKICWTPGNGPKIPQPKGTRTPSGDRRQKITKTGDPNRALDLLFYDDELEKLLNTE